MTGTRDPVGRAFQVLAWLVDHGDRGWGITDISTGTGLPPATVHRVLGSLERLSIVEKDGSSYEVGMEMQRLSRLVASQITVESIAEPMLKELVNRIDEQVFLVRFEAQRGAIMFTNTVEANHQLRYTIEQYQWQPLHAGASCLGALAFVSRGDLDRILEMEINQPFVESFGGADRLKSTLRDIAKAGYALTRGRHIDGAVGVGAPVFDYRGEVIANVLVTIPDHRYDSAMHTELVDAIKACANSISTGLGYDLSTAAEMEGQIN